MGSLADLLNKDQITHMLYTSEEADLSLYIQDTLKATAEAKGDSVFRVRSKKDYENMLDIARMPPLLGEKWLFVIEYSRLKLHKDKMFRLTRANEIPSVFLYLVENYGEFKEIKKYLPDVNDMYMASMRRPDVEHILAGTSLTPDLLNFVGKSYFNNPDKICELATQLKMGTVYKNRAEITDALGTGTGTMKHYVFSLLGDPPKNATSRKTVMKRRITIGSELVEMYGANVLRRQMYDCIRDIRNIKMLFMSAVIYDSLKNLPDGFDEKRLGKYAWDLDRIKELPLSRIDDLMFRLEAESFWRSDIELLNLLYGLYTTKGVLEK